MNKNSQSTQLIEEPDRLIVSYSSGSRVESALLFTILFAALLLCLYFLYRTQATILSEDWLAIPICLFGSAGLLMFLLRSGTLKSAAHINADGTVQQGIGKWIFPGPMAAISTKESSRYPTYWIDLRYGASVVRLPGSVTEGVTFGIAAQINRWVKTRIIGAAGPTEVATPGFATNITPLYFLLTLLIALVGEVVSGGNYHLNPHAKIGPWATTSIAIFAVLAAIAMCIRWATIARIAIRRGAGLWGCEVAIALFMILGACAIVGRYAQIFEMLATPATSTSIDEPLRLTKTTTGKGCHRFLILEEPSLGRTIQYCDPHTLDYWNGVEDVQVRQSSNAFGIRIESIDRIDRPQQP